MPPQTTPPDINKPIFTAPWSNGDCGNCWTLLSKFDFSLLGPRVPALLISPWLEAGIDKHQYQNTSVLRFLIDRLSAQTQTNVAPLTERDKEAPNLEATFRQFGTDTKRENCPERIESHATLPQNDPSTRSDAIPYADGKLSVWDPPPNTQECPPMAYMPEVLRMYVSSMPGHADTGNAVTQTFATNADVASYVQERVKAAERFHASSLS